MDILLPVFLILVCAHTLQVVLSFSDGLVESACDSMRPVHGSFQPQASQAPYSVKAEKNYFSAGEEITVILKANSSEPFRGFLLEASDDKGRRHVGTFTLIDPETQLLNCRGFPNSAVSQTVNRDKHEVRAKWKSPSEGLYFFRATFVRRTRTFWVPLLPTPSPDITTTTVSTSTNSVSTTGAATSVSTSTNSVSTVGATTSVSTSTNSVSTVGATTSASTSSSSVPTVNTTSTVLTPISYASTLTATTLRPTTNTSISAISTVKNPPPKTHSRCEQVRTGANVMGATLAVTGMSFKMARRDSWYRAHVCLMSLFATATAISFIFLFVNGWNGGTHAALVCVVMILTIIQIIVAFFRCGPSHELRFIFRWFHRLNAVAIACVTVVAVFSGLADIDDSSSHLQKLMGGFVAWITLCFILQILFFRQREKVWDDFFNKTVYYQEVLQIVFLVVFTLVNVVFLGVLLVGIAVS